MATTRWLRFSLEHLFALTLGIVIGFAPFRLHEYYSPSSQQVHVDVKVAELANVTVEELGFIPAEGVKIQLGESETFLKKWEAACRAGQLQMVAESRLITLSKRPMSFQRGVDRMVDGGLRFTGTMVQFRPTILKNGRIELEFTYEQIKEDGLVLTEEFVREMAVGEWIAFHCEPTDSAGKPSVTLCRAIVLP